MTTQSTVAAEDSAFVAMAEFLDHDGKVPSQPFDLFFLPPLEIGKILSARSSLRVGKRPLSGWARFGINLLIPVAFFAAVYVIAQRAAENPNDRWTLEMLAGILAVLAFPFILLCNRAPKAICSYVGEEGVTILSARRPTDQPSAQLLLIKDAAELHASQVRHYHNGIYAGTKYLYYWTNFDGRTMLKLKGGYYAKKGALAQVEKPLSSGQDGGNRMEPGDRGAPTLASRKKARSPSVSTAPVSSASGAASWSFILRATPCASPKTKSPRSLSTVGPFPSSTKTPNGFRGKGSFPSSTARWPTPRCFFSPWKG